MDLAINRDVEPQTWRTRSAIAVRMAIVAAVFAGCLLYTFATASFTNDDYLHLALAQQVVLGGVPVRDFIDPGELLFYGVSAAAQVLFGRDLLSEFLLDVLCLSVGHAIVFVLAFRATRSYLLSALVTIMCVLLAPRLYSYPKIVLYPLALTLIWRYADQRRDPTLVWLAVLTAVAFLFRHDHGVLIGVATGLMLVLSHHGQGWRVVSRKALLFGGATTVLLLPFLWFVHVNGGVLDYWRITVDTARAEYRRTVQPFPSLQVEFAGIVPVPRALEPHVAVRWKPGVSESTRRDLATRFHLSDPVETVEGAKRTWTYSLNDTSRDNIAAMVWDEHVEDTAGVNRSTFVVESDRTNPNAIAWFYYLTILLPPLTLLVCAVDVVVLKRRPSSPLMDHEREKIVAAAVLAALMHLFLLRSTSSVAVADVSSLTAVLAAWLLARGLRQDHLRREWRGVGDALNVRHVAAFLTRNSWPFGRAAVTLAVVGISYVAVWETAGGVLLAEMLDGRIQPLAAKVADLRRSSAPFGEEVARYVHECTSEHDRLLVATEYAPNIYYRSGRGFAAGRPYFLTSLAPSAASRAFSLARLRSERVPIVLSSGADYPGFARAYPPIDEYLRTYYREVGAIDDSHVLVDHRIPATGTHGPRSLPCFKDSRDRVEQ